MTIRLEDIWRPENREDFKIHFGRWDGTSQPLEAWVRSRREWHEWNEYWPGKNDFNRPLIFSLISFYHEPDTWLFGGIFKVLERMPDLYAVEITEELGGYVGRLKLSCAYRDRQTRPKLEGLYDKFEVKEVLSEPYTGRTFPGFENIDVSFDELQALVNRGRADWKAPLSSVKGVYLISDVVAGKRYIGSAYSDGGIWARWREYALPGHGGNGLS